MLPRLPWERACVFLAMAATVVARLVPSNDSSPTPNYSGALMLQNASGQNLTTLVALTNSAILHSDASIKANLYNTNETSLSNITHDDIAYVSCDPEDYPGNVSAEIFYQQYVWRLNVTATIFYSRTSTFCNYAGLQDQMQVFPLYTMSSSADSKTVLNDINGPISNKFFVSVVRYGDLSSSHNGSNGANGKNDPNQNPLGPSPSTAVAMIILYSITGIITALFLVIIITGAVRAHRHPDRYGPRDVMGRPRQSRARGLGRAILDTLPIVKFGEREPPKPTDVELGSTSEARDVNNANAETDANPNQEGSETGKATDNTEAARNVDKEHPSGISPAEPLAAGAASGHTDSSPDEGLGCSICTDDFEKGQDIRVLPCNHKFHPECVDPWLLNVSGTCPLCRVDLRPATSHSSTSSSRDDHDPDLLAPPLQPEAETSNRRRSALRDILSLRSRPNASTEERITALRRFREQRRNLSREDASGNSATESTDDVTAVRRSRRISTRLHDVFSVRTRRNGVDDPAPSAEASASGTLHPPTDNAGAASSSERLPESQR